MSLQLQVFVTTRFEGMHFWADAPLDVSFLRHKHRHVFHVRLTKSVLHADRDIEFIMLKRDLEKYIKNLNIDELGSCEMIALDMQSFFDADSVEVSEDGENGAIVSKG